MPASKNNERKGIRNKRLITVLPVIEKIFEKLESQVIIH